MSDGSQRKQPGMNFASFDQVNGGGDSDDTGFGLGLEPQKQLDLTSLENIFEDELFMPSISQAKPATMGILSRKEDALLGKHFTDELGIKQDAMDKYLRQEKWQVSNGYL